MTAGSFASHRDGRLGFDSVLPAEDRARPGTTRPFGPSEAILHIPPTTSADPMPLVVLLHGAGGHPAGVVPLVQPAADRLGCALVALQSTDYTWDLIVGGFGADVEALDALLPIVCRQVPVDPARVAIAGFSDGASYALSLGLRNGSLFSSVIAFSPGFRVPGDSTGHPSVFVSHGRADTVLPIDRCSRRIVPALRREGYEVDYREFDGGHEVPPDLARAGMELVERHGGDGASTGNR